MRAVRRSVREESRWLEEQAAKLAPVPIITDDFPFHPPYRVEKHLSEDEVRRVRAYAERGATQAEIARAFGVSRQAIHNVVRGRTHRVSFA